MNGISKKGMIVVASVAALVLALGATMWFWFAQPPKDQARELLQELVTRGELTGEIHKTDAAVTKEMGVTESYTAGCVTIMRIDDSEDLQRAKDDELRAGVTSDITALGVNGRYVLGVTSECESDTEKAGFGKDTNRGANKDLIIAFYRLQPK
ncbi:hypothetical protein [Arcanobacterium canis]